MFTKKAGTVLGKSISSIKKTLNKENAKKAGSIFGNLVKEFKEGYKEGSGSTETTEE